MFLSPIGVFSVSLKLPSVDRQLCLIRNEIALVLLRLQEETNRLYGTSTHRVQAYTYKLYVSDTCSSYRMRARARVCAKTLPSRDDIPRCESFAKLSNVPKRRATGWDRLPPVDRAYETHATTASLGSEFVCSFATHARDACVRVWLGSDHINEDSPPDRGKCID